MTHTASGERGHHTHSPEGGGVPSTLDPAVDEVARRARHPEPVSALPEVRWAALSLAAFLAAVLAQLFGAPAALSSALYAVCYVAGGWEPLRSGLAALRERTLDVDLLMIVAAVLAAAIGQTFDGALLIVIFATSGALEALATKRTQDSVRALLQLAPEQATRLVDGVETVVDTALLVPGDLIVVRPGERIGADGVVESGSSDVEQASITGEPLPVSKRAGDGVFAGTMNGAGVLRVRVERAADDSVVARIVALVAEASATKAKRQLFVERIEQRYSVIVVVATIALLVVPMALGAEFQPTLLRAMTFMIVASPCAVVLATMPPLLSAIALAGRHGVLVKSAAVMEELGHTTGFAFDKTGTLTEGTPQLRDLQMLDDDRFTPEAVLSLAASAESPSEHPLGRAIVAAARERGIDVAEPTDFVAEPGRGITALVDGHRVAITRPLSSRDADAGDARSSGAADELQREGRTVVVVEIDGTPTAFLGLVDRARVGAAETIDELNKITGQSPVLLTGDNEPAARLLATSLGIDDLRADLLPADKAAHVHAMTTHGPVAVVGDGVNDAPMLAAATTGIAMGRGGSDLALETADVVLVGDDLTAIPKLLGVSRRARRVVTQNLVIAASIITVLVLVDLFGYLPLPLGVLGHEGSTVVVGLNGLRLLSNDQWRARK